ncbi:dynamin family protein [Luteimonas sp. MC1572]|uniref:dynamin family protein n=1 Tax=Luteimonas sp. MC1572 TaxID=2799325 RepID=UPI0018F0D3E2|nr:dynamin family protein [Luteimonas sp. MC1572]MBJ6980345.1 dynamin family protein [Luteimonas sp. MC1572]QQO04231.1 dynamin family protein [Luteimonas sp. MC1572]
MNLEDLVAINRAIEQCVDRNSDLVGRDANLLLSRLGVSRSTELSHAFAQLVDENRLLQIGIVGRVKAGKSSLLNALIFNGQSILPKAATPMTAALTTLTHGDTFSAQVQFYTPADRKDISEKAAQFDALLKDTCERTAKTLRDRQQRTGQVVDEQRFSEQVEREALRAMRADAALMAAHDQHERMRKTRVSEKALAELATIHAANLEDLSEQLKDFVGADGRYTALTKSVDIFLPLDSLRDIRITDTPGLNDPVQSREERTTALLSECDVVFIVSPAGQFLSEQDLQMMGRITRSEGIQEIAVIASQIDSQMHGEDTRRDTPRQSLESINAHLAEHMVSTLRRLKTTNPEVGSTFDKLIEQGGKRVLHTSGICHSLAAKLAGPERWDGSEQAAWNNLHGTYREFFDLEDPDRSRAQLELLANTAEVRALIEEVRYRKQSIVESRIEQLTAAKRQALDELGVALIQLARQKREQITATDLASLRKQKRSLSDKATTFEYDLDSCLEEWKLEYRKAQSSALKKALSNALKVAYGAVAYNPEDKTQEITTETPGAFNWVARNLWNGGRQTTRKSIKWLYPNQIKGDIINFARTTKEALQAESSEVTVEHKKKLTRALADAVSRTLGDEIELAIVIRSLRSIVARLPSHTFSLDATSVKSLRNDTTLQGTEAERFIESATNCLAELKSDASRQISTFTDELRDAIPDSISDQFVTDVLARIEDLEQQIEHRELTKQRLDRMVQELEAL